MKCVGCGGEMEVPGGILSYGEASIINGGAVRDRVTADYHKTLCPKCTRVLKSIILNSDLSDHWSKEDLDESD